MEGVKLREQAIESFLTWLVEEKGSTENTIAAYRNDLSQFLGFLASKTTVETWAGVTVTDVRAYREALKAREYAASTAARKIASVRSFFHYLLLTEVLDDDPTVQVATDALERLSPEQLPHQAARRLWDSVPGGTSLDLRDRALVALVAGTGLKTGQVVALDLEDVELQGRAGTIRLQGRRGEEETLTLSSPVTADLARYVCEGRPQLATGEEDLTMAGAPLFLNARGKRLSRQGLWLVIKGHGKEAGLEQTTSPRTLRGVCKDG
jgi:integrase/recombinase XerD